MNKIQDNGKATTAVGDPVADTSSPPHPDTSSLPTRGTSRTYPLNAMQWEMYEEWSEDPEMTQYNLLVCVDVPVERLDRQRACRACQQVLDGQRYFHAHLIMAHGEADVGRATENDGQSHSPMICEDWDMPNAVRYYEMSDEAWERSKADFTQPFDLFHEPAGRLIVVATPTKTIVGVELHHLFFDGLSADLHEYFL